ncbi:MAG: sugar phosphate isomerase/epimerase family protein [Armatimonadota bacterium]
MKLAVFTDEVSQELDTAVKLAVRYQLDGVELRTIWNKPIQHLNAADVDRVRKTLGEHNLAVAAIASPVFKCELDNEAEHRDHLEFVRNCCKLANLFDTTIVRVFTFWKRGPSKPVWEKIKTKFRPAIPIARDAGVTLAIENEPSTYCATAAETAQMVKELDSPTVRVVWDPCNEVFAEEGITPYPDAYRKVEGMTVHVHAKDGKKDARGAPHMTPVGEGVIDLKGQLADLLKRGYQGYLSLETHWRPAALPEAVLNQPGGAGFSEAGEYASDLCMKNLLGILAEARREATPRGGEIGDRR